MKICYGSLVYISRVISIYVHIEGNLRAAMRNPAADSSPTHEHKHLARVLSFSLHLCEKAHYQQTNQLALLSEHPLVVIRDSTDNPQPGNTELPTSQTPMYTSARDGRGEEGRRVRQEFCLQITNITSNCLPITEENLKCINIFNNASSSFAKASCSYL